MKFKYLQILIIVLACLAGGFIVQAQETGIKVVGFIKGSDNKPVSNVSVSILGIMAPPVITDQAGKFTIHAADRNAKLIINPPEGYKTQTCLLYGRNLIHIRLTADDLKGSMDQTKNLFEFIERGNIISAIGISETDNIYFSNNISIDNHLKGNHSGIWGVGRSGMPGSGTAIFIRGLNSLNANNQPLYVIDGIPIEAHGIMGSFIDGFSFNPLTALNPADVTDLTIIKDNTQTSIFGLRGSNGVILIETLKPTEVHTVIDFTFRTGFSSVPRQIPQLNSDQYRTYAKEVLMTSDINEEFLPLLYQGLYISEDDPNSFKYNNSTNWQDIIFRNSIMYDTYLRILGGDEIARYGLSVGYQNNEGIINQTSFDRFSVRFVGRFNIFKWLKFNVSSTLTSNTSSLKESARIYQTSPILTSLMKNPLMIPFKFDSNGNQLTTTEDYDELGVSNPYAVINGFSAKNKNYRFLTTFNLEGDISEKLKFNSLFGLNFNSLTENIFMPNKGMELYFDGEAYNASKTYTNYLYSITNDNFLNYSTYIGKKHSISANSGFRMNINKFQADWAIAKNSHENDEYTTLSDGTAMLREIGGYNGNWNRLSLYTNLKYSFLEKYSLQFSAAAENSSRIGPNAEKAISISEVPFGLFYGAGISWLISEESFLYNVQWLNDLKLRISYGKTGNDDIGDFDAFNYYYPVRYRNATGMVPGPMTNESLTYEDNNHFNTGFDFSAWGNRLRTSVNYFLNRSSNMLIHHKQNYYMGHVFLPINDGKVENKGIEIDLFGRILSHNNLKWDIRFNISQLDNQIIDLEKGNIITPFQGGSYYTSPGNKILNFYGYVFSGVYTTTEEANLINSDGIPFGAGDAIYEDISGPNNEKDGVINEYDKTIIGSPIPDFFGGFNTSLNYKRWYVDMFFQWVYGNEVFNYVRSVNEGMSSLSNQSQAIINRWQYEGHETNMPRSLWGDPMHNTDFSSRWIEDGSYIRLKDITIRYKIDEQFLNFRNTEIYITASNLITLSRYLGYDPEFAFSFRTIDQGIDYGLTPHARSFLLGIKLGL